MDGRCVACAARPFNLANVAVVGEHGSAEPLPACGRVSAVARSETAPNCGGKVPDEVLAAIAFLGGDTRSRISRRRRSGENRGALYDCRWCRAVDVGGQRRVLWTIAYQTA
jgi:hypothetical protein